MVEFQVKKLVLANFKSVSELMRTYIENDKLPCLVGLVYKENRIVFSDKYGFQNIEKKIPISFDSLFYIYSITKVIVSVGAMLLIEDNKLALDDYVSKYIPEFKNLKVKQTNDYGEEILVPIKKEITIKELMTHTAGFTYDAPNIWEKIARQSLKQTVLDILKHPLLFQPSSSWKYSFATDILGYVIEIVSGKSLKDYLKERIFIPLNMKDTSFNVDKSNQSRLCYIYYKDEKGKLTRYPSVVEEIVTKNLPIYLGGMGLVSSVVDLLKFSIFMLNKGNFEGKQIIRPETIDLITNNYLPQTFPCIAFVYKDKTYRFWQYGFGLGVRVKIRQGKGSTSIGEYGWDGAASTYFWIDPQKKIIGIIFSSYAPVFDVFDMWTEFENLVYTAIQNQD